MSSFRRSEESLRAWSLEQEAKARYKAEKLEKEKQQELKRRTRYAEMIRPQQCLGDPFSGVVCGLHAVPGSVFCLDHGGNTAEVQNALKLRLLAMCDVAFKVLNRAMASNDLGIALKAAVAIIDRAGMGPHSTLEIKQREADLSQMHTDSLKNRYKELYLALEADNQIPVEPSTPPYPPSGDKPH
jgi:hypothetical protein